MTLTQARLKALLTYDAETGVFVRLTDVGRRTDLKAGQVAGSIRKGYRDICIDGRHYPESRLAWLYVNGAMPAGYIDHINGNPLDNRIRNLRDATPAENSQNMRRAHIDSSSGLMGIYFHKASGLWHSSIMKSGKKISIGYFKDKYEAHSAYLKKKAEVHPFQTITDMVTQ